MSDFIIKKLPYDLTSNARFSLVGQYMKRLGISNHVDRKFPVGGVGGIANSEVLKSYLGGDADARRAFACPLYVCTGPPVG